MSNPSDEELLNIKNRPLIFRNLLEDLLRTRNLTEEELVERSLQKLTTRKYKGHRQYLSAVAFFIDQLGPTHPKIKEFLTQWQNAQHISE